MEKKVTKSGAPQNNIVYVNSAKKILVSFSSFSPFYQSTKHLFFSSSNSFPVLFLFLLFTSLDYFYFSFFFSLSLSLSWKILGKSYPLWHDPLDIQTDWKPSRMILKCPFVFFCFFLTLIPFFSIRKCSELFIFIVHGLVIGYSFSFDVCLCVIARLYNISALWLLTGRHPASYLYPVALFVLFCFFDKKPEFGKQNGKIFFSSSIDCRNGTRRQSSRVVVFFCHQVQHQSPLHPLSVSPFSAWTRRRRRNAVGIRPLRGRGRRRILEQRRRRIWFGSDGRSGGRSRWRRCRRRRGQWRGGGRRPTTCQDEQSHDAEPWKDPAFQRQTKEFEAEIRRIAQTFQNYRGSPGPGKRGRRRSHKTHR